jgi:hypothetical protein
MNKIFRLAVSATAAVILVFVSSGIMAAPANDDFDVATIVVEPLPFNDPVDTRAATVAIDDPICSGRSRTVWYTYTPSSDGPVESNTFGSNYDTTLSVYTGARGNLTQIACNDDTLGLQSRVIWDAEAATTYYLMVSSFASGAGGDLSFEVKQGPVPISVALDVESALVTPSNGEATVAFAVEFSQPVFVIDIDAQLLQRSGRGAVFDTMDKDILDMVETINLEWIFTDMFGSKGYTGGPAELCVTVRFNDPVSGSIEEQFCSDIRLQGSSGKNGSKRN